jgi:hypothetical protein
LRLLAATSLALGALVTGGLTATQATGAESADSPRPMQEEVNETIPITEDFDGGGAVYVPGEGLGSGDQSEEQEPVFEVSAGATLSNLTIAAPGADGIHCVDSCTLENITWEDVGEDAATFDGPEGATYNLVGGSATAAEDKVIQFNGGGTLNISGFTATDFGTMVRSCGDCSEQTARTIVMDSSTANAPADTIVGINENFGDTATITNLTVSGSSPEDTTVCQRYIGTEDDGEPEESGDGPDGTYCLYEDSDVTWQ